MQEPVDVYIYISQFSTSFLYIAVFVLIQGVTQLPTKLFQHPFPNQRTIHRQTRGPETQDIRINLDRFR